MHVPNNVVLVFLTGCLLNFYLTARLRFWSRKILSNKIFLGRSKTIKKSRSKTTIKKGLTQNLSWNCIILKLWRHLGNCKMKGSGILE